MMKRNTAVRALLVFALGLPVVPVAAQRADDEAVRTAELKKESSAHFRRGAELFEEGLFRAALVELQRAYELVPHPRVLYNIGQTHVALGEFVSAIRAFEALLAQGGGGLDKERQAEVRSQIAQLMKRTGVLSIRVEGDEATIAIDGVEIGPAPLDRVLVDVGRRAIVATSPTGASAADEVDVAGGDLKEVTLRLTRALAETPAPVADETKSGLTRRQKWAIGLVSGAGGLALTGMAVAFMARSSSSDLEDARESYPGDRTEIEDAHDQLSRRSLSADLLFASAAAVGVTGVVLLLTKSKPKVDAQARAERFRIAVTPRALIAEGRF